MKELNDKMNYDFKNNYEELYGKDSAHADMNPIRKAAAYLLHSALGAYSIDGSPKLGFPCNRLDAGAHKARLLVPPKCSIRSRMPLVRLGSGRAALGAVACCRNDF